MLDITYLPGALMGIELTRIAPELREKMGLLQEELHLALAAAFDLSNANALVQVARGLPG